MKFLFICIALFAVSAWSNVNLVWTNFQFERDYLEIDSSKICNVDTTYINCSLDKGLVYYSTLDTSYIVIFNPLITRVELYKILSKEEMPFSEDKLAKVLHYEFLKWVEWGIIKMPKDSAQRLMDRIMPESRNLSGTSIVHKKVCDEDLSLCRGTVLWGGGSEGIPEEYVNRLPQKKVLLNAESENPGRTSLKRDSRMSSQSVGKIPLGTSFNAFDMNGIYLYQGSWQGGFKSHGRAVILKFDNGKTVVFR